MPKKNSPIIKAKPFRGREMKTDVVPDEVLDTMKLVAAKKTMGGDAAADLETPKDNKVRLYHEGYVGDKLYLVPDENLELMADDVNTQLRLRGFRDLASGKDAPKRKDSHKRVSKLSLFTARDSFFDSSSYSSYSSEEELEEKQTEELIWDEKTEEVYRPEIEVWEAKEEVVSEPIIKEAVETEEQKKDSEIEQLLDSEKRERASKEEKSLDTDKKRERDSKEEKPLNTDKKRERDSKEDRLRLLISGHFREDEKPIYLVQEYREEVDLFKDEKPDFQSKGELGESGVDASISAKFYDRTILEELRGIPVALNTKTHRIPIDQNNTLVYDDQFEKVYPLQAVDVILAGEFLRSDITKRTTPFLSLGVKENIPPGKTSIGKNGKTSNKSVYDNSATTVFTCKFNPTMSFPSKI